MPTQEVWNRANVGWMTDFIRNSFKKYSSRQIEYLFDEYNLNWNDKDPDDRMTGVVGGIYDALVMVSLINSDTIGGMAWVEADPLWGKLDSSYERRPASYLYQFANESMHGSVVTSVSRDPSMLVMLAVRTETTCSLMLINRSETDMAFRLISHDLPVRVTDQTKWMVKRMHRGGGSLGTVLHETLTRDCGYYLPANTVTILSLSNL